MILRFGDMGDGIGSDVLLHFTLKGIYLLYAEIVY